MSSFFGWDEKCPKCGDHKGSYEIESRIGGYEWFICGACGWGFQRTAKGFGQNLLSELRDVIAKAGRLGWNGELDERLIAIADRCVENGWSVDRDTLVKLRDILSRDPSERNLADWEFVEDLSKNSYLFVLKAGKVVFDYEERCPDSELWKHSIR